MAEYKNIEFIKCIDEFIKTTENINVLLKYLLKSIEKHHIRCNAAKTVGTVTGITGSALMIGAIIAAPFTGGASIVVATGIGGALASTGALTSIGTDIYDYFMSKDFQKEIESICEQRKEASEKLQKQLDAIQVIADGFLNGDFGLNEEESLLAAFMAVKMGKGNMDEAATFVRTMNAAKNFKSVFIGMGNGGRIWRGMRVSSTQFASVLRAVGVRVSRRTAMNFMKAGTVVLQAVFVIVDIKCLINDWKSNHPTAAALEDTIKKLEKEVGPLRILREELFD